MTHIKILKALFNPLNAVLNHLFHLLALLGAHHIFHISGLSVNKSETVQVLGAGTGIASYEMFGRPCSSFRMYATLGPKCILQYVFVTVQKTRISQSVF
jgi:hypothetical protein